MSIYANLDKIKDIIRRLKILLMLPEQPIQYDRIAISSQPGEMPHARINGITGMSTGF